MATLSYENVSLATLGEDGTVTQESDTPLKLQIVKDKNEVQVKVLNGDSAVRYVTINKDLELARIGTTALIISTGTKSLLIKFSKDLDAKSLHSELTHVVQAKKNSSIFAERTDAASAEQYFQFYGYLSQQQNMMQDYIRTSTYQRAMLNNTADFQDKVVLDVGAGSGILSFFAAQAGAKKVYAIEASSMALHCQSLVDNNKLGGIIEVIPGKIEEVDLPEKVDMIISEPMGYMLFNERMLETFLHAKKWLKPSGQMFPTQGDLHITPFTDEALYMEQFSKANFWYQQSFHGVDLSGLRQAAIQEYFKQPIVDTFDVRICMARSHKYTVDFQSAHEQDLHHIEIPVSFTILQSGTVHGLAFWFDVAFIGSQSTVWLSTSPTQPLTHWYQVRCLLQNPIFVKQGQTLTGKVLLRSNKRQSYDVEMELSVPGTNNRSSSILDLKNPFFRYTGQAPQPPPGTNQTSPSEAYWNGTDPTLQVVAVQGQNLAGYAMLNGMDGQTDTGQHGASSSNQGNLIQLANMAPINPGSIPSATVVSLGGGQQTAQQHMHTRTSVGGGISPAAFNPSSPEAGSSGSQRCEAQSSQAYLVSNQFMIGDYAVPGSMVLPSTGLNLTQQQAQSKVE